MEKYFEKENDFPIFEAKQIKDKIVVSGGGGGQNFGVPDQIKILQGNSFETICSVVTKSTIYEKTIVSEANDWLIMVSENIISLQSLSSSGKLTQLDVLEVPANNTGYILMAELIDDDLFVYDNVKTFYVYRIKGSKFHKTFESELGEKILGFVPHPTPKKMIFVFAQRMNVFDLNDNKFVEVSYEFTQSLKKVFWFYSEEKDILVLVNSTPDGSVAYFFRKSKVRSLSFDLITSQKFISKQITCLAYLEKTLTVSTVDGQILVYAFDSTARLGKIYERSVHMLPARSLILRRMPTTYDDANKLMLISFGIDYKMVAHIISKKEYTAAIDWVRIVQIIAVLILLLAILIGALKQ